MLEDVRLDQALTRWRSWKQETAGELAGASNAGNDGQALEEQEVSEGEEAYIDDGQGVAGGEQLETLLWAQDMLMHAVDLRHGEGTAYALLSRHNRS